MRLGTPGFVGARLKQAREARDLSAAGLADMIGVTRSSVYQYEGDIQSPSPDIMKTLAEKLNVPIQRFMIPMPSRATGLRYYRCMASATKRARVRAERKYEWLRDICDFVGSYIKFTPVDFPELSVSRDPAKIPMDEVELLAQETRKYFRLPDGPVANVVSLLEKHGAIISRYELDSATLDAFSEWAPDINRPFIVLSSNKESAVRSRFDACHELGHLILHRNTPASYFSRQDSFGLMEKQAHRFASSFLLPESSFTSELFAPTLDAFRAAKPRWRVAIAAMIMRASDLKLVNEDQAKRLWMNLGRRKWRTKEPFDDTLEPEVPKYLARCVSAIIERGFVSPEDMEFHLGLSSQDIAQLTCVAGPKKDDPPGVDGSSDQDEKSPPVLRFPRAS